MLGLCGIFFRNNKKEDDFARIQLDLTGKVFTENGKAPAESIIWNKKNLACKLFYRESERFPAPDKRLESSKGANGIFAAVFGTVCVPQDEKPADSQDPLYIGKDYLERQYKQKGLNCLRGINGNWAAAIYDKDKNSLVLSRDFVGIQALYYSVQGDIVYFSTHLGAFAEVGLNRKIDFTALAQFLHYLYIPSPLTAYKDIYCAPIGKAVEITPAEIKFHSLGPSRFKLKKPLNNKEKAEQAMQEALPQFEKLLINAVKRRMAPKGRTAIFLSGGKDSSCLCVAASKIDPKRFLAVTVGFDDPAIDETQDAALAARHLGIEHHAYKFKPSEYLDAIEEYVHCHAQPFGDPAGLPLFLTAGRLPDDIEVIFDGGGDLCMICPTVSRIYDVYPRFPFLHFIAKLCPDSFMKFLPKEIAEDVRILQKPLSELFVSWNGWAKEEIKNIFGWNGEFDKTEIRRLCKSRPN